MQHPVSLKSAERKAFQMSFADGLWDVFIGCIVLMFVIAPFLSQSLGDFWSSFIFLPFWGLVYLAIWLIRKYVVAPRTGAVVYNPQRRQKLRTFSIVMLCINLVVFLLGIVAMVTMSEVPGMVYPVLLGVFLLFGFSAAAYILDYPRLYIYGLLLFAAPLVGEWLYTEYGVPHHGYPIVYGFVSGLMILAGLVTFVRFLYSNPIVSTPIEGA